MPTIDEIKKLSSCERVAGYLLAEAKLAAVGARLRKDGRSDNDWTPEEEAEWDNACDELDPWWYALTAEEMSLVGPIDYFIGSLTCAEWPPNK